MRQQFWTPTFALALVVLGAFATLAAGADNTQASTGLGSLLGANQTAVAECFTEKTDCTGDSQQVGPDVQWEASACQSVRPTNEIKICQGCIKNTDHGCEKVKAGDCVQLVKMTSRNPLTCFMS